MIWLYFRARHAWTWGVTVFFVKKKEIQLPCMAVFLQRCRRQWKNRCLAWLLSARSESARNESARNDTGWDNLQYTMIRNLRQHCLWKERLPNDQKAHTLMLLMKTTTEIIQWSEISDNIAGGKQRLYKYYVLDLQSTKKRIVCIRPSIKQKRIVCIRPSMKNENSMY